jgi:hypothetical protein
VFIAILGAVLAGVALILLDNWAMAHRPEAAKIGGAPGAATPAPGSQAPPANPAPKPPVVKHAPKIPSPVIATPPPLDSRLVLLNQAIALRTKLSRYQEEMLQGYGKLEQKLDKVRKFQAEHGDEEEFFALHKPNEEREYYAWEVKTYEQRYGQDAARIQGELLEQVPEHGLESGLDYGHIRNGSELIPIKADLDILIQEFQTKLVTEGLISKQP